MSFNKRNNNFYIFRGKRIFDLLLTIPALIVLSPIIAIAALLVRFQLGSPVLFKQTRPGLHEKPFIIFKFRTMTNARGIDGELLPDEKRLTSFGRFLRATSLDELPELFNVLKGDMRIVGPRPLLMEYLPLYTHKQARRHELYPGITGWAQINGRNAITWEEKFKLDVWYVDNQSFWLDIKIIFLTIKIILKREGINDPEGKTWFPFTGTTKTEDSDYNTKSQ
ncbi:MAG: sugar transferase [Smithella sp.]|jgi:sugar transferase EpsL